MGIYLCIMIAQIAMGIWYLKLTGNCALDKNIIIAHDAGKELIGVMQNAGKIDRCGMTFKKEGDR